MRRTGNDTPKHLVIDVRAARTSSDGLGNYIKQIVPRLVRLSDAHVSLIANGAMRDFWSESAPRASIVVSAIRPMWVRQNWEIPALLREMHADLFFYPAHDPPLFTAVPFVFTIHDLTPHIVRPYFETHDAVKTAYLRLSTRLAVRRATAVLAVSEATRAEIGKLFGPAAQQKTVVTLNGSPGTAPILGHGGTRTNLLYVGGDRPHKNIPRLLEAYAVASSGQAGFPKLDFVGQLRSEGKVRAQINSLGLEDRVVLHGHVTDAELERFYQNAMALVVPSIAEGFGIPIVEAMMHGVPVVASNTAACTEVGGDAVLLVDPLSVQDMARGLVEISRSPERRADLVERGLRRYPRFDWDRSAERTHAVLTTALNARTAKSRGLEHPK